MLNRSCLSTENVLQCWKTSTLAVRKAFTVKFYELPRITREDYVNKYALFILFVSLQII